MSTCRGSGQSLKASDKDLKRLDFSDIFPVDSKFIGNINPEKYNINPEKIIIVPQKDNYQSGNLKIFYRKDRKQYWNDKSRYLNDK